MELLLKTMPFNDFSCKIRVEYRFRALKAMNALLPFQQHICVKQYSRPMELPEQNTAIDGILQFSSVESYFNCLMRNHRQFLNSH